MLKFYTVMIKQINGGIFISNFIDTLTYLMEEI